MDANLLSILMLEQGLLSALFAYIGILRFLVKPMMSLFHYISKITPTKVDDKLYTKIRSSLWYNTVVFIVDWFTSLKMKQ